LQTIVTDHHAMPAVFPPADAIIHPLVPGEKYPDKTLAGGGVAFKLAQALLKRDHETNEFLPGGERHEGFEKWLLDMVSISTVGDMVPLTGESRALVRYGLTVLNKTRNIGLQKLLISSGAYDTYQKLLIDNELLDFGDLISYCLQLFQKRSNILKFYQSKFKFIMVDEFQDTNYAQYELVKLLASPQRHSEPTSGAKNLDPSPAKRDQDDGKIIERRTASNLVVENGMPETT
jgi:hypothetical protein